MKRIGSLTALVSIALPMEDVRPPSGISPQVIMEFIGAKYNFLFKPSLGAMPGINYAMPSTGVMLSGPTPIPGLSVVPGVSTGTLSPPVFSGIQFSTAFRNGTMSANGVIAAISYLDLNLAGDPGALMVQASSTEVGDVIIDDVLSALTTQFGFRNLDALRERQYYSNVVVEFDGGFESRIGVLGAIQRIINTGLGARDAERYDIERITFAADPTTLPASKIQTRQGFVIERRANHNFAENRYFSSAPMRTSDHFVVLEQIDAAIDSAGSTSAS